MHRPPLFSTRTNLTQTDTLPELLGIVGGGLKTAGEARVEDERFREQVRRRFGSHLFLLM